MSPSTTWWGGHTSDLYRQLVDTGKRPDFQAAWAAGAAAMARAAAWAAEAAEAAEWAGAWVRMAGKLEELLRAA